MANKEKEKILTENQIKLINLMIKKGVKDPQIEHIALHKMSTDNFYCVMYDYMATGIHIPQEEVDELQMQIDGIRVWKTVYYKF